MSVKTTAPQNTILVEAYAVAHEIGFINSLVEEYEGLAVMRTRDRHLGHLKYWVPQEQWETFKKVFDDFISQGWVYNYHVVEPWWEIK